MAVLLRTPAMHAPPPFLLPPTAPERSDCLCPDTNIQVQVFLTATGFVYVGCGDRALRVACGSQVAHADVTHVSRTRGRCLPL